MQAAGTAAYVYKNVGTLLGYNLWDLYEIQSLWEKMSEMTEDLYENHLIITRQPGII